MRRVCPVCGQKNLVDPEGPRHIKSKRHRAALVETDRIAGRVDPKSTGNVNRVNSQEFFLEKITLKLDILQQRIDDISEKLSYLLVSTASPSTQKKNVIVTPDFIEFIIEKTSDISEMEVLAVLSSHTLGIVVAFFDQDRGPVPIIVIPESLKENYNLLINLVDLSFGNCQVLSDFENESSASFELSLGGGLFVNCLSFGFSLNRPRSRGGAENITLSILINNDIFPLVSQFTSYFKEKVHEIHLLMDSHQEDKDKVTLKLLDLRKFISSAVLAYNRTYSFSKMKDL
ncbi:MAG: hypothetical protein ACFFD4_39250 [Candidatus Odinarchaeota archaeon]